MKKVFFFLFIATLANMSPSMAQKISERPASWDKQLCLTLGGNIITGSDSENFNPGIGIDGIFYYRIGEQTFVSAGIGFHILNVKEEKLQAFLGPLMPVGMTAEVAYFALPLSVGVRHNFTTKGFQPYVGADLYQCSNTDTNDISGFTQRTTARLRKNTPLRRCAPPIKSDVF